ncbi:hypothetical protein EVC45_44635 [Paraburkholderia sp. UYCP14C]|uniref:hypothetical protein n=1 Tax=Paraburkholderia sp. UYCP14C TaxID=2511130 RepID=UPI001021FFEF|nr:hypothetical protein [Paraburkholderia sp. UYCP14C]RZF23427.1 hypothetical protein EVC45_44635 [Paraburkholderia sp. UYCP14C]
MGEAKRWANEAAASITPQQREIAALIDAQMQRFEAAGLDEAEIVAAMVDHMSGFHRLMTDLDNPAINLLAREFAGFRRYAKIVETIASGIATGQIQVPGKERRFADEHRIAASIDQRVRQLEANGIRGVALLAHMAAYTPDLQRLWNSTSDELLVSLCRTYPSLYRYGELFEQAWLKDARRMKPEQELPDSIKPTVLRLLSDGATLEREFQTILDARPHRDLWVKAELLEHTWQQWTTLLAQLPALLQEADVPNISWETMRDILEPMAQRIEDLRAHVQHP